MRITFWGARGSIPVPGSETFRYGGNTPCVSIEHGTGLLVLDAGTGIRRLGEALMAREHRSSVDVVLSHSHMDHIQGLPFFAPVHDAAAKLRIYGPPPGDISLHEALSRLMTAPYWPAHYSAIAARLDVTEITAPEFRTDYFRVRTLSLRHPGRTLGYAVAPLSGGPTVIYMTDNELGAWLDTPEWRTELVGFLRNGDMLIHDATYGDSEIPEKSGWGHSSASQAVDVAIAAGVRKLVLFHHAPEHSDEEIDRLLAEARRRAAQSRAMLIVEGAAEGLAFDL